MNSGDKQQVPAGLVQKFVSTLRNLPFPNLKDAFFRGKDATIAFVMKHSDPAKQLVRDHGVKIAATVIVAAVALYVYRRMTRATRGTKTDEEALQPEEQPEQPEKQEGGRRRRRSSKRKQKRRSSKRKQKRRSKRRRSKRRR